MTVKGTVVRKLSLTSSQRRRGSPEKILSSSILSLRPGMARWESVAWASMKIVTAAAARGNL